MSIAEIRDYCEGIYATTYINEKQRIENELLANSRTGRIPSSKKTK